MRHGPYRAALLLAKAELVGRPRRYARLFLVLAAATCALFLVLALLSGVQGALGRELKDTLVGDVRLSAGDNGVGEGEVFGNSTDVVAGLEWELRADGARFTPRFEVQALVEHGGDLERWRALLLVGVDPATDPGVAGAVDRIVEGRWLGPPLTRDFVTYYPALVSREFLGHVNVTVWDGAGPILDAHVLNATAGRELQTGSPVKVRLVPVGVYETGFKMMDSRTMFVPIQATRVLVGEDPRGASATTILGATPEPERAVAWAQARGFNATTGQAFTDAELAPMIGTLRVVAFTASAMLLLAAVAWVAHAMGALIHEDRREIAALRAVGLPARAVALTYVAAGAGVGVAGGVAGLVAGSGAVVVVNALPWSLPALETLRVSLGLDAAAALGLLGLAAVVSVLAIALAFRPVARESIAAALRDS